MDMADPAGRRPAEQRDNGCPDAGDDERGVHVSHPRQVSPDRLAPHGAEGVQSADDGEVAEHVRRLPSSGDAA